MRTLGVAIRRADLARAYLLLERAISKGTLSAEDRALVNRGVDQAMLAFFAGQNAPALERLNQAASVAAGLRGRAAVAYEQIAAQRGTIEPPFLLASDRGEVRLTIESLVPGVMTPADTSIVVTGPDGVERRLPRQAAAGPLPTSVAILVADGPLRPGRYEIGLVAGGIDKPVPLVAVPVLGEAPAAFRSRIASRLDALDQGQKGREADRLATRSRLELLAGDPAKSAVFLADLERLEREVATEVASLEAGNSPWIGQQGDRWRTVRAGLVTFPVRVYVPEGTSDPKRPLVIALHGAGGDENMFFEGYGAGLLPTLAREKGFVLACPATTPFLVSPALFDALIDEMVACHGIDPSRVYVLGHSMGAGAATRLGELRGDRIAALAMIAGGTAPAAGGPPAMLVAAGKDPLFPVDRIRADAERATGAGASVRFLEFPDEGHLLVVERALPEVVTWLLAQPPRSPSPR